MSLTHVMSQTPPSQPIGWTIAGADPTGGAGIQADLSTFDRFGVHGCSLITASTAQNTHQVIDHYPLPVEHLALGAQTLLETHPPTALKIGMTATPAIVQWLTQTLPKLPGTKVFDPVMISSSGQALSSDTLTPDQLKPILPLVDLITPNRMEAEALLNRSITHPSAMVDAAQALLKLGARAVLLKGGHLPTVDGHCADILATPQGHWWLTSPALSSLPPSLSHGTGCRLSAGITAALALGYSLLDACVLAKATLTQQLLTGAPVYPFRLDASGLSQHTYPWLIPPGSQSHEALPHPYHRPQFAPLPEHTRGLYPIVDSVQDLAPLLQAGVKLVQVRIKDRQGSALEDELMTAIALGRQYQAGVIINDYWTLALEHGAFGVHLGQSDLDTLTSTDLHTMAEAGMVLGVSTHCPWEVARALAIRPSYMAIGPIHPTTTKTMSFAPQGLAGFQFWRHLLPQTPLVAIGGLFLDNAAPLIEAGADAIAVVRDLAQCQDVPARVAAWHQQFDRCISTQSTLAHHTGSP